MLPLPSTTITIFKWLGAASGVMVLASMIVTPWFLVRMPADYFTKEKPHLFDLLRHETLGRRVIICLRNALGVIFLLLGLAMLVLPGQGALTILMSLYLIDFPKKKELEGKFIRRPRVLKAVNWLRQRAGKGDLIF